MASLEEERNALIFALKLVTVSLFGLATWYFAIEGFSKFLLEQ